MTVAALDASALQGALQVTRVTLPYPTLVITAATPLPRTVCQRVPCATAAWGDERETCVCSMCLLT